MEYSNKTNKEKLFKSKTSNLKAIFHKSPSYNKSTNKTKIKNDIINFNNCNYKQKLIYNNLKKYSISAKTYNQYIINDIIFDHRNHIVAEFKNYLLWDETSEFLKRYYQKKDVISRLPKISEYYEQYTLFTPNYLSNDGLVIIIMIKWIKRKKKYMQYLEEKEEASKNNKRRKNLNQNFEPIFSEEIVTLTKSKSKSFFSSCVDLTKNTLEFTTIDVEKNTHKRKNSEKKVFLDKNNNNDFKIDDDFKNSISFTEIIDDLSSHFSILINNNYKDNKAKQKPIKSFNNKKLLAKKEINNIKNNPKKISKKPINQKALTKKPSVNKQSNMITKKEKEKENYQVKVKDVHKVNKIQKKINTKKNVFSKDKIKKEKEKMIDNNNKENNKQISNTKEIKKYQKVTIININPKDNKENRDINNINLNYNNNQTSKTKMKNISILNSNSGKNKKVIKPNDENLNTINTIENINPQYYSLGKLLKNNKQSSAIKKMSMKSLNLVNFNPNVIPNLKKIVSKQKDKKIIFPRNFNLIYNNNTNNTNKLNSIKKENYDQMKLLTDRDKESTNNKMIMETNENSKFIKLNENKNNNIDNIYFDQSDLFSKKISKLIKKKHISLIGDNLSFKEPSNSNILLYKNEMNDKMNVNNISNMNNLRYKKNSVLRQFNSKRDFNFSNSKNNLLQNFNNISNNSISSSSSSLNSLNKKKLRLSNYLSQNNSINKRKSLQKINLNLNLQINFNINLDKKNKKLILGKRLNDRILNEITNSKNIGQQNIQKNDSNNNSNNISVPLTQRCYYNVNQYKKYLGEQRSASSSYSKKKKRIKS